MIFWFQDSFSFFPPKFNISETGICVPINYILDSMKHGILVTSFFFMLSFFLKGRQKESSLKSKQQTNARLFTRALVSWGSRFLTTLFQFAFWIAQALYIPSFTIGSTHQENALRREA